LFWGRRSQLAVPSSAGSHKKEPAAFCADLAVDAAMPNFSQ